MQKELTDKQIASTRQRATELIEQHQREIQRLTTLVNGTASDREMRGAYRRLRFQALCKVFNNAGPIRRRDKQPTVQESQQDKKAPLSKEKSRWDA
jgi:hypothetical protein